MMSTTPLMKQNWSGRRKRTKEMRMRIAMRCGRSEPRRKSEHLDAALVDSKLKIKNLKNHQKRNPKLNILKLLKINIRDL